MNTVLRSNGCASEFEAQIDQLDIELDLVEDGLNEVLSKALACNDDPLKMAVIAIAPYANAISDVPSERKVFCPKTGVEWIRSNGTTITSGLFSGIIGNKCTARLQFQSLLVDYYQYFLHLRDVDRNLEFINESKKGFSLFVAQKVNTLPYLPYIKLEEMSLEGHISFIGPKLVNPYEWDGRYKYAFTLQREDVVDTLVLKTEDYATLNIVADDVVTYCLYFGDRGFEFTINGVKLPLYSIGELEGTYPERIPNDPNNNSSIDFTRIAYQQPEYSELYPTNKNLLYVGYYEGRLGGTIIKRYNNYFQNNSQKYYCIGEYEQPNAYSSSSSSSNSSSHSPFDFWHVLSVTQGIEELQTNQVLMGGFSVNDSGNMDGSSPSDAAFMARITNATVNVGVPPDLLNPACSFNSHTWDFTTRERAGDRLIVTYYYYLCATLPAGFRPKYRIQFILSKVGDL